MSSPYPRYFAPIICFSFNSILSCCRIHYSKLFNKFLSVDAEYGRVCASNGTCEARSKRGQAAHVAQGPPPPRVPEGWKAVWNDQYSEYFYVNVYTKRSQWDVPTSPVYPPGEGPPDHPPPSYIPGAAGAPVGSHTTGMSDKSTLSSNNPYANVGGALNISEDEKFARKLQEEEEARARSHAPGGAGASNDFYGQPPQNQYAGYPQQQSAGPYPQGSTPMHDSSTQDKSKSKGLLGKLKEKVQGHSSGAPHGYPQQQPHYGQQPAYGQPMGGGYYQQPGRPMMGPGMMGGGMPGRRPGGGMGAGGAMALGAGGGLLGGALLGSAMADAGDGGYGGDGGGDYGGDGGGDFGGGDMGGGDFGGGGD
ncbi:hypothetical protein CC86DRAFT_27722 [Ophiobolus disseminans]|uniref:WW domain-containing protein n=1 Tax=Ophiobolus disseminans TaxID=1469910 RepID=A0A6A7A064_9PLEO|nr:hypothetical protein CC86DRAFT_27722 [Ophiobolus disseminans]